MAIGGLGSGPSRRRHRELRWHHVVAGAALALGLYACAPVPVVTSSDSPSAAVDALALTRDGNDQYFVDRHGTGATVTAPLSNTGENTRTVFAPRHAPTTTDALSCATWVSESTWNAQEGVALRFASDGARVRAITVTKNIFAGATWVFNVHVWDTAAAAPLTQVGTVDLGGTLSQNGWPVPLPWRLCARALGPVVELKAWRANEAEPAWGDRRRGGSVRVDTQFVYAGRAGWYVGHLPPGGTVEFADLGTAALRASR